jgi:U3 small nucleolar RNA-associated protein 4
LIIQADGALKPKRIREFSAILQAHLPPKSTSTGGLAFHFSPDSSKLVISTAIGSYILIVDLGAGDEKPRVLRRFDHHRHGGSVPSYRAVKGLPVDAEHEDAEAESEVPSVPISTSILRLATSSDGQWLASSDTHARTHVYNLDSIQVGPILCFFEMACRLTDYSPAPLCPPFISPACPSYKFRPQPAQYLNTGVPR